MKPGDIVRLKPTVKFVSGPRRAVEVLRVWPLTDPTHPGYVHLKEPTGGFSWWNQTDLYVVKEAQS